MNEFMQAFNHGKDKIVLSPIKGRRIIEGRPTELHYKDDGDVNDNPSFAILMYTGRKTNCDVYGEVSLNTLRDCLDQLGYEIKPKET